MGFRRLVVHVGAPKTATTAIQSGLFTNRRTLAARGVHVPETGRLELEPRAIGHHHLAWSLYAPARFSPRQGGWEELAEELRHVDADTVLLSSEEFYRALKPGLRKRFADRLRSLCDEVTVVVFVREQLSLINSIYGQRVKALGPQPPFREFVDEVLEQGLVDYDLRLSPWYDAPGLTVRAVPFGASDSPDPLSGLLAAADVPDSSDLDLRVPRANPSLGPIGVEATRVASGYLRGRFPEFDHFSLSGRKLHRIAGRSARDRGWCRDPYWGWTPELAEQAAARLAPSNERFSRAVWGTPWPLPHPVERPQRAATFEDLPPAQVHRVSSFALAMAEEYQQLESEEAVTT